ncbi:M24 family metallopeptidase [uncultured Williamsia sp.]|uniref:M24 family metallopeptidase n=1 Tax=uncultured Williamsia sp. TaxID=259311 RepID=UPI00260EF8BB|nr:M24 family metallopeptidase [uncultured Williamsia sp.]
MTSGVETDEDVRIARLVDAEARALELFDAVVARDILVPGVGERAASDAVRDLAADRFGVDRFWHKRIVRAGPNTLHPYAENPPDRVIGADDIVFLDFGPVLEKWEADVGRTYVVGDDPHKHALAAALQTVWDGARDHFAATPDITGEQLYEHTCRLAADAGWEFGGSIAGHLVGEFPHKHISGAEIDCYVAPGSTQPMRRRDRAGLECHWILEVHLVDRDAQIGGFVEQLLDIGPNAR